MELNIDQHRREYADDGLTIIPDVIPAPLLTAMRAQAERLCAYTRHLIGPDASRPPGGIVGGRILLDFPAEIDPAPFAAFADLPRLRNVVDALLGADYQLDPEAFTMLFATTTRSSCQRWHRDYRDNVPTTDLPRWLELVDNLAYFNQFNAALYDDVSLWVVPGSHRRDDTPLEAQVLASSQPDRDEMTEEEYVVAASGYRRSMPGALKVSLSPGDVAFYRDSAIHLGNYIPTMLRATLHGHFESEVSRQFFTETFGSAQPG